MNRNLKYDVVKFNLYKVAVKINDILGKWIEQADKWDLKYVKNNFEFLPVKRSHFKSFYPLGLLFYMEYHQGHNKFFYFIHQPPHIFTYPY